MYGHDWPNNLFTKHFKAKSSTQLAELGETRIHKAP